MREGDSVDVGKIYRGKRTIQSVFGFMVFAVGVVMCFWLPVEKEMIRIAVGALFMLLGGTMVDSDAVKAWVGMFGGLIPFKRK